VGFDLDGPLGFFEVEACTMTAEDCVVFAFALFRLKKGVKYH